MKITEEILNKRPVNSQIKVEGQFVYGDPAFTYGELILTAIKTNEGEGVFYISDEGQRFTPLDIVNRSTGDIELL